MSIYVINISNIKYSPQAELAILCSAWSPGQLCMVLTSADVHGTYTSADVHGTYTSADVHGTYTSADVHGTYTSADVHGTYTSADVHGTYTLADVHGTYPTHLASSHDHLDCLKFLVRHRDGRSCVHKVRTLHSNIYHRVVPRPLRVEQLAPHTGCWRQECLSTNRTVSSFLKYGVFFL